MRDLYRMLDEINSEEVPVDLKVPDSFDEFIWDMKNNDYDLRSFAFRLKATVSFFPCFEVLSIFSISVQACELQSFSVGYVGGDLCLRMNVMIPLSVFLLWNPL
jgi:hypothetical protein